jgi:anti-anti-sigma factor
VPRLAALNPDPFHENVQALVEQGPDHVTCRLIGTIDTITAPDLRDTLELFGDVGRLIIDLTEVRFIDSFGVRALAAGVCRLGDEGVAVALACGDTPAGRVLRLAGLDTAAAWAPSAAGARSCSITRAWPYAVDDRAQP